MLLAVMVIVPVWERATVPVHDPVYINAVLGMNVGSMVPESTDKIVNPGTFVVVCPFVSLAVMVILNSIPAQAFAGV